MTKDYNRVKGEIHISRIRNGDMFMIGEDFETTEDWNAVRLAKGMAYADENPEVVLPGFTAVLGIISMLGTALLVRKNE